MEHSSSGQHRNNSNENALQTRKRRRSSFINKTVNIVQTDDEAENEKVASCSTDSEEKWKKIYIEQLKNECKDWNSLVCDTRYKYKDTVQKSERSQFFDKSCLTPEEAEFLNGTGVYKKLAQHLDELTEEVAMNLRLREMLTDEKNKVLKLKERELDDAKSKIYENVLEDSFSDTDIDTEKLEQGYNV